LCRLPIYCARREHGRSRWGFLDVKHIASLTAVLTTVWLAWSGHYETLTLALGAGSILFVVALSNRLRVVDAEATPLSLRPSGLLLYIPWLAWEILKANLDVARRIVSTGTLTIAPRIIRVKTAQSSDLGRVVYANSITLTPGTISIDVADGEILIHALHAKAAQGVEEGSMNRKCAALERNAS
jgi:multicomponent Na+:H+ antiporter subunit E